MRLPYAGIDEWKEVPQQSAGETRPGAVTAGNFMKINLEVGDVARFTKTLSESDVYLFAGITGDFSPNHINEEYGRATSYGGRIAHGLLVLSMSSVCTTMMEQKSGQGCVGYGYDKVRFTAGVLLGDTLAVSYTIDEIDHEGAKAYATVEIHNQHGRLCVIAKHVLKFFDAPQVRHSW